MNDDHSRMIMDAIAHAELMVQQTVSEYNEPRVFLDGTSWCALYGDNIQEGVCGFGDIPAAAILDFNNKWYGR